MTFLALSGLLALLSLPAILILHLLKTQRQELRVPSTMLWEMALRDLVSQRLWRKLIRGLLLALQMLACLLLGLAFARPSIFGSGIHSGTQILIIDTSASMSALDGDPEAPGRITRLDAALERAREILGALHPGDRAMTATVSNRLEIITPLTEDRGRLTRELSSARQTYAPSDWSEVPLLLDALARTERSPRIVILSDGVIDAVPPFPGAQWPAGSANDNAGIVGVQVALDPAAPGTVRIKAQLLCANPSADSTELVITVSGRVFDVVPVRWEKDGAAEVETAGVPLANTTDPFISLRLPHPANGSPGDLFPADDEIWIACLPERAVNVALVSSGNYFLERALLALPNAHFIRILPNALTPDHGQDVVVFEELPDGWTTGGALGNIVIPVTAVNAGRPAVRPGWSAADHPVTRGIRFDDVWMRETPLPIPPWAQPVLSVNGRALAAAGEQLGTRTVFAAFGLYDSNWPLKPGFPLFIAQAVEWICQPARGGFSIIPAGASPVVAGNLNRRWAFPDGRTWLQRPGQPPPALDLVGRYSWEADGAAGAVAVSLLSANESRIAPRTMKLAPALAQQAGPPVDTRREIWRWFAAPSLLLLIAEWFVFSRRNKPGLPRMSTDGWRRRLLGWPNFRRPDASGGGGASNAR